MPGGQRGGRNTPFVWFVPDASSLLIDGRPVAAVIVHHGCRLIPAACPLSLPPSVRRCGGSSAVRLTDGLSLQVTGCRGCRPTPGASAARRGSDDHQAAPARTALRRLLGWQDSGHRTLDRGLRDHRAATRLERRLKAWIAQRVLALAGISTLNRLELEASEAAARDCYRRTATDPAAIDALLVDRFLATGGAPSAEIVPDLPAPPLRFGPSGAGQANPGRSSVPPRDAPPGPLRTLVSAGVREERQTCMCRWLRLSVGRQRSAKSVAESGVPVRQPDESAVGKKGFPVTFPSHGDPLMPRGGIQGIAVTVEVLHRGAGRG